jgi:hypothetical protein
MNIRVIILIVAAYFFASVAKSEQLKTICTPSPTVCTTFIGETDARFDPFVQHMLVREQLQTLPTDWRVTHFYVPYYDDHRALEEMQIQFLDHLNQREAAGNDESGDE